MLREHNLHYNAIDLGQGFAILIPKVEPYMSTYLYKQQRDSWYQLYWYRDGKFHQSYDNIEIPERIYTAYKMYCLRNLIKV